MSDNWLEEGLIYVLNADGTFFWDQPFDDNGSMKMVDSQLAFVDTDQDGCLEIAFATRKPLPPNKLYVVDRLKGARVFEYDGHIAGGSPFCGDIDGNDTIDIGVACYWGIYIWDTLSGQYLSGFPYIFKTRYVASTPTVCDLNKDGRTDLVGSRNDNSVRNWLYCLGNIGDYHRERIQWPIFHHDTHYSGNWSNRIATQQVVAGPGSGPDNPSLLKGFTFTGLVNAQTDFLAYTTPDFGVRVACGDVDGDLKEDIITGPGPGATYSPHVRGFDMDGNPLFHLFAYEVKKYGAHVACGDVDGDGYDEIITGPGPGSIFGPHVRGWDYDGNQIVSKNINYKAYQTTQYGVEVACGDVDGDGYDEIITGPGPGPAFGTHVRGWDYDNAFIEDLPSVNYFAYGQVKYGVKVTCGDMDGDGYDEIMTGPGPFGFLGAHVKGWNVDGGRAKLLPGMNFLAYQSKYGVNVASGAVSEDGFARLVTGPGPGSWNGAVAKVWEYREGETLQESYFRAFDFRYGLMPVVHTFWY